MARRILVLATAAALGGCVSWPQPAGSRLKPTPAETIKASRARAPELLGPLVDGLYYQVLGRPPDPVGRAGLMTFLQNGGTLEQAVISLVVSPEYARSAGTDTLFVQSLFRRLLGRAANDIETANLLRALSTVGRAEVANSVLRSGEFRTVVVLKLYGFSTASPVANLLPSVLHRVARPTTAEVAGWANSDLDALGIAVAIASSREAAQKK